MLARLAFLTALAAAGPVAATGTTVAVLPVIGDEVPAEDRAQLAADIRREIRELEGFEVQVGAETEGALASAEQRGFDCAYEALACQASAGLLLGTDHVLVGRLRAEWSGEVLELRVLDVMAAASAGDARSSLPRDPELRARVLRGMVLSLVAAERTASLDVTGGPQGDLYVDGVAVATRAAPVTGLASGPHVIEIKAADTILVTKEIELATGEMTVIDLPAPVAARGSGEATSESDGLGFGLWMMAGGGAIGVAGSLAGTTGLGAAGLATGLLETQAMTPTVRYGVRGSGLAALAAAGGSGGIILVGAGLAVAGAFFL